MRGIDWLSLLTPFPRIMALMAWDPEVWLRRCCETTQHRRRGICRAREKSHRSIQCPGGLFQALRRRTRDIRYLCPTLLYDIDTLHHLSPLIDSYVYRESLSLRILPELRSHITVHPSRLSTWRGPCSASRVILNTPFLPKNPPKALFPSSPAPSSLCSHCKFAFTSLTQLHRKWHCMLHEDRRISSKRPQTPPPSLLIPFRRCVASSSRANSLWTRSPCRCNYYHYYDCVYN